MRLAAIACTAFIAPLAMPAITLADCVAAPEPARSASAAKVAFVGTVVSTTRQGRSATVSVEEIWAGPDLPAMVVVDGSIDPGRITSVDRTFRVGARYLFLPKVGANGSLSDDNCSSTSEWTADLASLRPASFRTPGTGSSGGAGLADFLAPVGITLIPARTLLAVGLVVHGRYAD